MSVSISILEFFCTGAFGPLRLGMTRAQIEAVLGPPDAWIRLSRRERRRCKGNDSWYYSGGWYYGDVELFFEENTLRIIHLDFLYHHVPSGGEKIQLDPWILHPGLALDEAKAACIKRQLAHTIRQDPHNKGMAHLVLETGAYLYFFEAEEDEYWPRGLHSLYFPDRLKVHAVRKGGGL